MARALGLFGFTGGFLFISPALRQTLVDVANTTVSLVHQYSPYSYVGIVLVAFGGVTLTLVSGSSVR
ncbi:MAG TPA: hypothetical protein VGF16_05570 [Bryobacteraceae bacterium]